MQLVISKPLVIGEGDSKKTLSKTTTETDDAGVVTTHDVLDLDFDKLTGADMDACAREASFAKGEAVRVLVTDLEFHVHVAARAAGVEPSALKKLGARDYVEVATAVQSFLTGSL